MALEILAQEKVWLDKAKFADAERVYYERLSKVICSYRQLMSKNLYYDLL